MTQTIALIGAGYTLQRFMQLCDDYEYHETHRSTLEATSDSISGDLGFLDSADAMIFSLPPSPGALNLVQQLSFNKPAILLSSIGVYEKSAGNFDESAPIGISDRAQLIHAIENEFLKLDQSVVLRLGGLFDDNRHPVNSIIKKQITVQGNDLINFVHIDDVCQALDMMLQSWPKQRLYNLVDRHHPTKKDYYTSLTTHPINFSQQSGLNYQVSSKRFLTEIQTDGKFLNRLSLS